MLSSSRSEAWGDVVPYEMVTKRSSDFYRPAREQGKAMMPLEQQVPNRELCEKMKELGFQQDTHFYWVQRQDGKNWMILDSDFDCNGPAFFKDYAGQVFAAPTVSELGQALPIGYCSGRTSWDDPDKAYCSHWYRVDQEQFLEVPPIYANSEADARAKMWVHLRESGLI